jgi:hypothetical protein
LYRPTRSEAANQHLQSASSDGWKDSLLMKAKGLSKYQMEARFFGPPPAAKELGH